MRMLNGCTAPMFHIADCAGLFAISQIGGSHFYSWVCTKIIF